ncbi:MAG: NAD-dependent dehydratase [Acidobacteria bacterium]|nr:MAG: NAD-dependent dehydratase [Acidobacteriota bacterium]
MVCLVTGASGFLGSHLARLLVQHGEQVRVLVRPRSQTRALAGLPVERVGGDLRDASSLVAAVQGVRRVFHLAADYRLWTPKPQEIYDSNVAGTRHLLAAARRAGVEKFVYTSSVATLAVPRGDDLPDEQREVLAASRDGLPVVVVHPTAPVGPGDWKPTPTGRIILDFLNGRMPAYVETGLNLVPVESVAAGHLLAAERGRIGERYILGGRNMMLKEIFAVLSSISGRPSPRIRLPLALALVAGYADSFASRLLGREPRVPLEGVRMARHKMFVNSSKAEVELGFRAGSIEAALERAVRWYSENNYLKQGQASRHAGPWREAEAARPAFVKPKGGPADWREKTDR